MPFEAAIKIPENLLFGPEEVIPAIVFDAVTVHAVKTIAPFEPLFRAALTPAVKTEPFALTTPVDSLLTAD
jgi:hypothetical protein